MKTIELSMSPVVQEGWLHSRELGMVAVNIELLMVCLLVSGVLPKLTWLGATAMFSVFSVVSGYLFLIGAESCNCFGRASVPPLYTVLFDLTVVGLLLLFRSKGWGELRNEFFGLKKSVPIVAVLGLCLALPATYAMLSVKKIDLAELGTEFIGADGKKTVILDAEKWIGMDFPLMEHIDVKKELGQGIWLVLLHTHTCSACRECVLQYSGLALELSRQEGTPKIAMLELPPYDTEEAVKGLEDSAIHGKLDKSLKWQIKSPILVLVDNRKVQNVFDNPLDVNLIRTIWGNSK